MQGAAAAGDAVGWLQVPTPQEVAAWVDGLRGSRTVVALDGDGDVVLGSGTWARHDYAVLRQNAELRKVMVRDDARGRGVGRALVQALVADARAAGVELLTLECRGNNHAALRLYADVGFVTTGRRPDCIAVGQDRFDQVLLHLDLRPGPGATTRRGSRAEGPGRS